MSVLNHSFSPNEGPVSVQATDTGPICFSERGFCIGIFDTGPCGICYHARKLFSSGNNFPELFSVGPPGTAITLLVTHNFLLEICATPPRAVALRHSIPSCPFHLLRRCTVSGRRELNPDYTHPKRAYYRHTPARHRTPPCAQCAL